MRDYYFDNIKAVLILFVVFGHLIEFSIEQNPMSEQLYTMIYYFHMPAFILISGYFAKKSMAGIDIKTLLWKIGLPYVFFHLIYVAYHNHLFETEISYSILTPYWLMWFMFSFFLWQILLYIMNQFKYGLIWSIVVGLIAGIFIELHIELSLLRTFVYFPFFFLGAKLQKKHFIFLKKTPIKLISIGILVGFYILIEQHQFFPHNFLRSSIPYEYYNFSWLEGIQNRAIQYGLALVVMASLFSLIPIKKTILSRIGTYTIYIFLLHGFLVRGIQRFEPDFLTQVTANSYFHFLLIAIVFSFIITIPWVRLFFKPLIEPMGIFKRK